MAVLLATMDLNFQQMPSILAQPYGTLRSLMKVSAKTEDGHTPLDHLISHHRPNSNLKHLHAYTCSYSYSLPATNMMACLTTSLCSYQSTWLQPDISRCSYQSTWPPPDISSWSYQSI